MKHERWHFLKQAYERYVASSAVVEAISAEQAEQGAESELVRALEVQQRAFQDYMDARIAFLEYHVDQFTAPETAHSSQPGTKASKWLVYTRRKSIGRVLTAAVVCVAAFSTAVMIRLWTYQRETAAPVAQMIKNAAAPAAVTPSVATTELMPPVTALAMRESDDTKSTTARNLPVAANPLRYNQKPRLRPSKAVAPRVPKTRVAMQKTTLANSVHYDFALSPSHQSHRVGSLRVVLMAIDPRGKSVKLSVVDDAGKIERTLPAGNRAAWTARPDKEKPRGFFIDWLGL